MDQGARRHAVTPLTIFGAQPSGARAMPSLFGLLKSHTLRIFTQTNKHRPNFTVLGANSSGRGTYSRRFDPGGLGHVDHLVCRDDGIAASHGTRAESGTGADRRRPHALRRHLSSTRLLPYFAPASGAEIFRGRGAYSSDTRAPPWRS